MPKIIQLKTNNTTVYPKGVFKSVRNINLRAGERYVDKDILKASLVIVYFTVTVTRYRNQFVIPRGDEQWYINVTNNWITYAHINWISGTLLTSNSNTDNENHFIIGYDLIA